MSQEQFSASAISLANINYGANDSSNYRIAGTVCNAFAMGKIGSTVDFWIVGSPAASRDVDPMITGNFLDSSGKLLFQLVRNVLVVNPGDCSKIMGKQTGFEIHDTEGKTILKVSAELLDEASPKGMCVTKVEGLFYNAAGQLIAGSQEGLEKMGITCPTLFGFNKIWEFTNAIAKDEIDAATACVLTNGAIHEIVTGTIENREIDFDGKIFIDATITKCKCLIRYGDFVFKGNCSLIDNNVKFLPPALNVYGIVQGNKSGNTRALGSGERCIVSGKYQSAGCGHSNKKAFDRGDTFPSCPKCQKSVAWTKMA
jgi:hypothetical protein